MGLNKTRWKALSRSILVLTALIFSPFWSARPDAQAQEGTTVLPDPPSLGIRLDDTGTIAILVENVNHLFCFELKVAFDPAIVQVVDADSSRSGVQVADGDFLNADWRLQNEADNEEGRIVYAVCQLNPSEPQSGSGTLVTITWRGLDEGTSPVDLYDVVLAAPLGEQIPTGVVDGEISVGSPQDAPGSTPSPSPTVMPTDDEPSWTTPSPTPTPLPSTGATDTPPAATSTVTPASIPSSTPLPRQTDTPMPAETEAAPTATPSSTPLLTHQPTEIDPTPTTSVPTGGEENEAQGNSPTESQPDPAATAVPSPSATAASIAAGGEDSLQETSDRAAPAEAEDDEQSRQTEASHKETPDRALFGLSYTTVWLVALACLVLGGGALAYASILWRQDQSER